MTHRTTPGCQRGVTLVELMVTMVITLFIVAAAAYMYLGTRETQRAIERNSGNIETGTFALQLIGQDIMMAGYYPAIISRPVSANEKFPKLASYPPIKLAENSTTATDWVSPAPIYISGLYGCDGAKFLPRTGVCADTVAGAPDSIVINYFTNDTKAMQTEAATGQRYDCTGADVGGDPSNANRVNTGNPLAAPLQPLLVSNRYWLDSTNTEVDKQAISTLSLACSGNGQYGSVTGGNTSNGAQPLLSGVEDMQFTYGVFASTADDGKGIRTPDKYYTATDVNGLRTISVDNGLGLTPTPPWSRVVSIRVCIMTKSMGATPRISDKSTQKRSYVNCKDETKEQDASDTSLRKRFIQIFPVRNLLGQVF